MIPIVMRSSLDATLPYAHFKMKILVPCPKAIPGTEKVLTTFSLSVWLTTGLVLLLTTAVFWCVDNGPYRSVCNETHTYQSLSNCFQNAWAVLVAVSVPQQPTASSLRVFFFLYVCFCFSISTVFQAFFVSYLVEPMYEKKIETLDELLDSDVFWGNRPALNLAMNPATYPEIVNFLEHKKLKDDCSLMRKCVERMITKGDIAIITNPSFPDSVAREMGIAGVGKIFCYLDETLMSAYTTMLFKKGNPLLERFHILRRYLEAGLQLRLWSEQKHLAVLTGGVRFTETDGDGFFGFSISHLMPAFMVMLVGTVLSSAVFVGELIVKCLCKRKGKIRVHALGK